MKRKHPEADRSTRRSSFHDPVESRKRRRSTELINDDQRRSSGRLHTGQSDENGDSAWIAVEQGDQVDSVSILSQSEAVSDSVSELSTQEKIDSPDITHQRTTTQQPWLSDTRFIDHFVKGTSNVEALRTHNSAVASSRGSDGGLRSPIITANHLNYFSPTSNMITPPPTSDSNQGSPSGLSPNTLRFRDEWFPSPDQISHGFELYFRHVAHFVPFIHPVMANSAGSVTPVLALSVLSIAYQYGEDPIYQGELNSGKALALHCFHRARVLLSLEDENTDDIYHSLALVQAYLLIEICAIMYLCGNDSGYGIKAHAKMIALARSSGVLQPKMASTGTADDLESLWWEFVKAESHKRTAYAVHQFDAMLYQFLSIPRSLSHLEMKHDLPCPSELWSAGSSAEWAHRKLSAGHSTSSISYAEAVRLLLAPEPKVNMLPAFDPYGAVNIAQFLISSAREISGWSVMTGRVSMERFEPLRSSLEALGPIVRGQAGKAKSPSATASEATWEIAMIELQMWSPSHTGGIIGGSIDAILREWTSICLGPWSETLFNASKAIQPYVDWYLEYLNLTVSVDLEPPWIALYAYKAYLIAWQLLRGGVTNAMQVVGVSEEDRADAISWAKSVFGRRKNQKVGRLILTSLDMLANMDGVG